MLPAVHCSALPRPCIARWRIIPHTLVVGRCCLQNHAGSSGGQWYGRLYDVMIEALRALATPQQAPGTPADEWLARRAGPEPPGAKQPAAAEAEPKMSGWLNVSTAEDFNTVHDHGDALWSMVRACVPSPPGSRVSLIVWRWGV